MNSNYEEQLISKCCEAPLMTSTGDEGTSCYICRKCKKPSDPKSCDHSERVRCNKESCDGIEFIHEHHCAKCGEGILQKAKGNVTIGHPEKHYITKDISNNCENKEQYNQGCEHGVRGVCSMCDQKNKEQKKCECDCFWCTKNPSTHSECNWNCKFPCPTGKNCEHKRKYSFGGAETACLDCKKATPTESTAECELKPCWSGVVSSHYHNKDGKACSFSSPTKPDFEEKEFTDMKAQKDAILKRDTEKCVCNHTISQHDKTGRCGFFPKCYCGTYVKSKTLSGNVCECTSGFCSKIHICKVCKSGKHHPCKHAGCCCGCNILSSTSENKWGDITREFKSKFNIAYVNDKGFAFLGDEILEYFENHFKNIESNFSFEESSFYC